MMKNTFKTAVARVLFLAMVLLLGPVASAAESVQVGDRVEGPFGNRMNPGTVLALAVGGQQADVEITYRGRKIKMRLQTKDLRKIDEATYQAMLSEAQPKPRQSSRSKAANPAMPQGPTVEFPPVTEMQPGSPLQLSDVSPRKPLPVAGKQALAQVPDHVTIELPRGSLHADRSEPLLIDAIRGRVLYTVAQKETEVMSTAAVLVDLESERFMEVGRWSGAHLRLVACNAERSVALMLSDLQDGAEQRSLTIVTGLAAGKPDARLRWPLPGGQETAMSAVRNAFLTSSGIAVVQVSGKVIAWDLGHKREFWTFEDVGGIVAFSPDGRFVAMQDKSQVVVVEVPTGTLFGRLDLPNVFPAGLAFAPDGQRLAVGHLQMLHVYDLSDWSQISQFELPATPPHAYGGSAWFDDRHLLLTGGTLVRPDEYLLAWKYDGAPWERQTFSNARHGLFATFFETGGKPTLVAARLPHASVPKELSSDRREDLAMQRGQNVKLEIDNGGSPLDAATLRSAIESFTRRIGWVPNSAGDATLQVEMEQMPARQLDYQSLFSGPSNVSAMFAPWKTSLRLVRGGDVIWKFDYTAPSPQYPTGDLQKALTRSETPDLKFLERIRLQPEIVASDFAKGFGQSRLTASGIEDIGPGQ